MRAEQSQHHHAGLLRPWLMPASSCMHAGALAGNPFGVDRQFIARELGMVGGVCPNSMDAVSDRRAFISPQVVIIL